MGVVWYCHSLFSKTISTYQTTSDAQKAEMQGVRKMWQVERVKQLPILFFRIQLLTVILLDTAEVYI